MKKIISVFICISILMASLAGCSSRENGIDLIYPFNADINSYDPQVAATSDEFLIVENCFEGLVRCDDKGVISPACAKSWSISEDELVYTFSLQQGLKWHIFKSVSEKFGEAYAPVVTAEDFVFALRRAVDPITNSPLYSTISDIENASEINSGEKDKSELGVYAVDDYTLEIHLSSKNDSFLKTLSTAVAMPCNEEFFNSTNGRYGLDLKYTLFNGQFVLTNVLKESYILKNNPSYNGPSPAAASDLTLKIVGPEENLSEKVLSGYYDAAYLRGYDSIDISEKSGVSLLPYVNTTWALSFNTASGILSSEDARHALTLALSEPDYKKFAYLSDASGYVPPSCSVGDKEYSDSAPVITEAGNSESAIELWKNAAKKEGIYSAEITISAPENMKDAAKELIQGIQGSIGSISNINGKSFSFSLKLETMTENELKSKMAAREFDIALCPFISNTASPVAFLGNICEGGFSFSGFEEALEKARQANSEDTVSACAECERVLYSEYILTPVFYESNYYAEAKGVHNVQFHPGSGRVSFIYATRED